MAQTIAPDAFFYDLEPAEGGDLFQEEKRSCTWREWAVTAKASTQSWLARSIMKPHEA